MLEKKNNNTSNNTSFNLIASIVSPNSTLDESGTAKLSKVKASKISKICGDIETLIPNAKPSLSQVLLSLNIYRTTDSSESGLMAALRQHLDSVIRKSTGSKNIDCRMKRFLSHENDVKMLSQPLEECVPNLWTSEQPLVNIATGKETPQEMTKNVKPLKQIGENAMNEFIARFTFQENNFSQNTYYDSIKKQKVVSFVTNSNKKMSTIAEDENKSFGEIFACFDNQTLNLRHIMN